MQEKTWFLAGEKEGNCTHILHKLQIRKNTVLYLFFLYCGKSSARKGQKKNCGITDIENIKNKYIILNICKLNIYKSIP